MSSDGLWCLLTWLALPLGDLYGVCPRSIRTDVDGSVSKTTTVMVTAAVICAGRQAYGANGCQLGRVLRAGKWSPLSPCTTCWPRRTDVPIMFSNLLVLPCHVSLPSSSGIPCIYLCLVLYIVE
jgi:hypothetical protein